MITSERKKGYNVKYRSVKANRDRISATGKRWAKNNPERIKYLYLRRGLKIYGLTPESYKALSEKQNNCCAICLAPPRGCRLAVDHCHETGRIRGLLCRPCNVVLGLLKEDTLLFLRAVEYLKEPQQ